MTTRRGGYFRYHLGFPNPDSDDANYVRSKVREGRIKGWTKKKTLEEVGESERLTMLRRLLGRFALDEIVTDPDAEFSLQIDLARPDFDLDGQTFRIPERLSGYWGYVRKITAKLYVYRPPEMGVLEPRVYLLTVEDCSLHELDHAPSVLMHVAWEAVQEGRYRLDFQAYPRGYDEHIQGVFKQIYVMMHAVMGDDTKLDKLPAK